MVSLAGVLEATLEATLDATELATLAAGVLSVELHADATSINEKAPATNAVFFKGYSHLFERIGPRDVRPAT
ncbi:MAG: hypothetical protein WAW85_08280 [Gordonia sp. (in: high G+C Gram-positive bacteria)]